MKILMINGSPNEKGCTFTALSEISKTLAETGVQSEIFHIGTEPVSGCTACAVCKSKPGRCIIDDTVNAALEKMEQCDGLIVGAPVHYSSPAGSAIAFLDRLFYCGACFAHKPAAAVVCARRAGTSASLDVLNKYFTISQMPVISSTYWNMVHGRKPEDVLKDAEGLQTMRNLARNMAWLLRCIEAGRQNGALPPQAERGARTHFIS